MKIQHYKVTKIANAPDHLSHCLNKYTDHRSIVSKKQKPGVDVVHFHNKVDKNLDGRFPSLLQFHSEPKRTNHKYKGRKLVLAQYHATLPVYKKAYVVRNVIDIHDPLYYPVDMTQDDIIRIVYSPTTKKSLGWYDKGYTETMEILEKVKSKHRNVELNVINGVSLEESLKRKSESDIVIDECKTGSYHRSGLEGLSLGKPTIAYVAPNVEKVLLKASGSSENPFFNTDLEGLPSMLEYLIGIGKEDLYKVGDRSRSWMETYWEPRSVLTDYTIHYEELCKNA